MDIRDFNQLNKHHQISYTLQHGTFLVSRQEEIYTIHLYFVNNFFSEIWYNTHRKCIERICTFNTCQCLESYLEWIDIKELLDQ